jgi:hypothetical protein
MKNMQTLGQNYLLKTPTSSQTPSGGRIIAKINLKISEKVSAILF